MLLALQRIAKRSASSGAVKPGGVLAGVTAADAPYLPLLPAPQEEAFPSPAAGPRVSVPVICGRRVELVVCGIDESVAELASRVSKASDDGEECAIVFLDDGACVPRALRLRDVLPHSWAVVELSSGATLAKFAPARSTRGVAAARTVPALALALGHGGAKGADESALLADVRGRLRRLRDGEETGGERRRGIRFAEFVQLVRESMTRGGLTDAHTALMAGDDNNDHHHQQQQQQTASSFAAADVELSSGGGPRDARLRGSEKGLLRLARALVAELERSGDVVRVRHSADSSVRDMLVLLREEDTLGMAEALDVDGDGVRAQIEEKAAELARLLARLEEMDAAGGSIRRGAVRQARRLAMGAGVFMVAQYAFIFHQIYAVSWDVMEPLCYFLAQMYAVAAYGFYLSTHNEPENSRMFGWLVRRRRQAMHAALEEPSWQDPAAFDQERSALVLRIASLRDEVAVLLARLGLSPDMGAAALAAPVAVAAVQAVDERV